MRIYLFLITGILSIVGCKDAHPAKMMSAADSLLLAKAHENAILANEGFIRSEKFVHGWLEMADHESGLIPRNLEADTDIWNAKDAAADNYPFMVLTSFFTDQDLFDGAMLDMLHTEKNSLLELTPFPIPIPFLKRIFKMKN